MKTAYPCNETHNTPKAQRNQITYQFLSYDGNTPARCTVRLGDTDPMTGEKLTDLQFFHDYYRQVDQEIYTTRKTLRPEYTKDEKDWRRQEAQEFINDFKQKYGYTPSRDDIYYHLEQKEQERYNLYYDGLLNPDGDSMMEFMPEFGRYDEDPFGADLPDDVYVIREFAGTLTGRRKAVFEAMLDNLAGGAGKTTNTELARLWGVSEGQIRKDQKMIKKIIIKLFEK